MPAGSWKVISLVSAVQVLSEVAYFAQGIIASEETNVKTSGQKEMDWIRICVPLFYAATRQISEPCWRWILGGYGDRMTTALGAATITVSIVAASYPEVLVGNAAYVILGGLGMGLVRLQMKLIKSHSGEAKWPLWGAGISGIGLSLWPLLACLFLRSLGPRYTMLILAGVTLHAVPLAMFVQPVEEDEPQKPDDDARVKSEYPQQLMSQFSSPEYNCRTDLPDIPLSSLLQEYRPTSHLIDYDSYRIRPSYYVEVLPGIPEEVEHDSDLEREYEMQRTVPETAKTGAIYKGEIGGLKSALQKKDRGRKSDGMKIQRTKNVAFKDQGIKAKPFAYTLFIATILLRLGDQFGIIIVIAFLPIFAGYLMPDLRLQEKAFLVSLCGFSRILAEFPLLAFFIRSKKTKLVLISGPLFAAVGLYLTWNSASLDAMTLASFGLGLGSGAASASMQILAPRESPGVSDTADIIVGFSLLGIAPLMRVLIQGHVVQGCLLLAVGIYAVAAITSVFNLRKAD